MRPYHVMAFYKESEGGPRRKDVLDALKEAGIPAEGARSCYVGHTAVAVKTDDKRKLARARRIVFGR